MRKNFLIKITNESIQILKRDNPNEDVNSKIQTCNKLSADYIGIEVGYNDSLSVTLSDKSTAIESECYQLIGSLVETIYLLKIELKGKQATINSLVENICKKAC